MSNFIYNHVGLHNVCYIFLKLYCTVIWSSIKIGWSTYVAFINYCKQWKNRSFLAAGNRPRISVMCFGILGRGKSHQWLISVDYSSMQQEFNLQHSRMSTCKGKKITLMNSLCSPIADEEIARAPFK